VLEQIFVISLEMECLFYPGDSVVPF
jgi:hypothetical protein